MVSALREFIPEGEENVMLTKQALFTEIRLADVQVLRREVLGKHSK